MRVHSCIAYLKTCIYIYIERERLFGIVTVTFVDLRVSNLSWKYTLDHVRSVRNTLKNGNRVPVVSVFIKVRDWVKAKLLYDVCENLKPHTCAIKFVKFTYNFAVPPSFKGKGYWQAWSFTYGLSNNPNMASTSETSELNLPTNLLIDSCSTKQPSQLNGGYLNFHRFFNHSNWNSGLVHAGSLKWSIRKPFIAEMARHGRSLYKENQLPRIVSQLFFSWREPATFLHGSLYGSPEVSRKSY